MCCSKLEYLWKDIVHPSSGHENNLEPESSSVPLEPPSSSSTSAAIALEGSAVFLGFTATNCGFKFCSVSWLAIKDGWSSTHTLNLLQGTTLPGPMLYAFHTFIPSLLYSTLFMKLTPSHVKFFPVCRWGVSATVTTTPGIPPEDSIAVFIWEALSMSWPSLRKICMWDLILAAFLSHAPFPPWGSEKSNLFKVTPAFSACNLAPIIVEALW